MAQVMPLAGKKRKEEIQDELERLGVKLNVISQLDQMISYANRTLSEYADARDYYENRQAPDMDKDDPEYLVDNLTSDLVQRLHGNLVGSDININYIGAKKYSEPLRVLTKAILRETKLDSTGKSQLINSFLVEGLVGIKFGFDPYKKSIFGLGTPVAYIDDPENIMLDIGSVNRYHEDDVFRARKKRITLQESLRRWPDKKEEIISSNEVITQSEVEYVDLYDMEYKYTSRETNTTGEITTVDKYFEAKYVGKTVKVEPFTDTGYSRFTILPFFHSPRKSEVYGLRPMGIPMRVKSSQDLRNILRSIMLEVAKGSTKHLSVIIGARDSELKNWDKEAAKSFGRVAIQNENAKVIFVPDKPLPPALVQLDQMNRMSFDENAGDYAPERGETGGQDLSGKAIALLQNKGQLSQFTARENLESTFEELGNLIIETLKTKMTNPFTLYDSIDGEESEVHFNTPLNLLPPDYQPNKLEVVGEDGVINSVENFPEYGATVTIDLNAEMKKQADLEKAMIAFERGVLSMKDLLRALYPEKWSELYANKMSEDQAMQIVKDLIDGGPEFMQVAAEQIERLKQILSTKQQQVEQAQALG
jgi:hypothetical protein